MMEHETKVFDNYDNMIADGVNYPSSAEVFAELKKRPEYETLVKFSYTPGTGKSATLDEIIDSITKADNSVRAFQALPELDRVKYYLAQTLQALHKILYSERTDVFNYVKATPEHRETYHLVSTLQCIADMALVTVPTMYRTTEVKI